MVLMHAQAELRCEAPSQTAYIDADVRDPGKILREAARLLDFGEPAAVMLNGIMNFIPDEDRPYENLDLVLGEQGVLRGHVLRREVGAVFFRWRRRGG
jgi:S-adenosyl methyltransferase